MQSSRRRWLGPLQVFLAPLSIAVLASGMVYAAKPAKVVQPGQWPAPFVVPQPAPGPWRPVPEIAPQPVPGLRLTPHAGNMGLSAAYAATSEDRCLLAVPNVDPAAIVPVRNVDARAIVAPRVVGRPVGSLPGATIR